MQNVTQRSSNPFGMRPPCPDMCDGGRSAVMGYGDANADFHVVGDHPGVHGGRETGVPFTGTVSGRRLCDVLETVGFLERDGGDGRPIEAESGPDADGDDGSVRHPFRLANCFCSYLHCCCRPDGDPPTRDEYAAFEPFFDAELRAIGAHVLVPVGQTATEHVLREYTARDPRQDVRELHGRRLTGSGFLVVPLTDPAEWSDDDRHAAVDALAAVAATDYAQQADLGRFTAGDEPYFVR